MMTDPLGLRTNENSLESADPCESRRPWIIESAGEPNQTEMCGKGVQMEATADFGAVCAVENP